MAFEGFTKSVASAYRHLYDLVYLRNHPLADTLAPERGLSRKEKAMHLHRLLLDTIEGLRPAPEASILSRQARCYRLLVLRYEKALEPRAVAADLAIGRRQYYREHRAAMEMVAAILWDRCIASPGPVEPMPGGADEDGTLRHLELLRLEAARTALSDRSAQLADVVAGLLSLLSDMLQSRHLELQTSLEDGLPDVSVDRSLLRQVLLGLLGYLIEATEHARIDLVASAEGSTVMLWLRVVPPSAVQPGPPVEAAAQLSSLTEISTLAGADLQMVEGPASTTGVRATVGFGVRLPAAQRTVLVVDDNEDTLELYRRYVSPHHYRVVTARGGAEALRLARRLQPNAITLDLMMPGQDGWDILQRLLYQPSTQHIPVIVCSILRQKELAISMGASAFLGKPVSEQALLDALDAVTGTAPAHGK